MHLWFSPCGWSSQMTDILSNSIRPPSPFPNHGTSLQQLCSCVANMWFCLCPFCVVQVMKGILFNLEYARQCSAVREMSHIISVVIMIISH